MIADIEYSSHDGTLRIISDNWKEERNHINTFGLLNFMMGAISQTPNPNVKTELYFLCHIASIQENYYYAERMQ